MHKHLIRNRIKNFKDWAEHLSLFKDEIFLVCRGINYTYSQFLLDINYVRWKLKTKNVLPGNFVGLSVPTNSYNYLVFLFGIISFGAVAVPVDPKWFNNKKNFILSFNMKCFIYDDETVGIFIKHFPQINHFSIDNHIKSTNEWIEIYDAKRNFPCLIAESSGSTGQSKNILLSQSYLFYLIDSKHFLFSKEITSYYKKIKTSFCFLPIKRSVLLQFGIIWPMSIGRKIYLESENILKDYQLFFSIYKKYNPDMLFCVSPLLQTLKNVIEKLPNCNLKILAVGGLLLDSKYTKFFLNKNIRIHNGYGTTETGVLLIANHKNMLKNNISVGVPVKNDVKFKILNDGELIIKSSAMMLGYYEQNKIFVPFDSNGYFHTNDLVYPQKCSIFKKMIIVSGRKTSSMNKTWKTVSCIENNNNVKNSKEIIFPDGSIKIIE